MYKKEDFEELADELSDKKLFYYVDSFVEIQNKIGSLNIIRILDSYIEYIYKTGDIVKYNEYGELIYLSRKDFQIKHMGYRIELGEIEANINAFDIIVIVIILD